jgi:hypothetical protein
MGGCCARQQDMNFDKLNSFQYSVDDIARINQDSKPELTLEGNSISNREEDIQLTKIIINLKNVFKEKVNTISLIELFNLAIYNKESFRNNEYIIFDMRRSSEQKEEFLKRIKHINYTYEQIKNIKNTNKYSKLKSFINNKKIIIIISEYYLNPKNNEENYRKVDEYPLILCQFLYDINNSINFKILNCCLSQTEKISYTIKFEEYLSVFHSDEIIPYILFSYQHVTNLIKEGFFFISFSATKIFSFEKKNIKNKNENNENEEIKNKLLYDMNISCIFIIEEKSEMNLNVKEINDNNNKGNIYKEINIKKKDFILYKEKIIEIKNWLRQEVIQGHSCFFNIINFEYDEINNNKINNIDWIYIIIIIICLVTEVEYESLINYFREKIIYIDKINELLNQIDKKEISDTLNFLNN